MSADKFEISTKTVWLQRGVNSVQVFLNASGAVLGHLAGAKFVASAAGGAGLAYFGEKIPNLFKLPDFVDRDLHTYLNQHAERFENSDPSTRHEMLYDLGFAVSELRDKGFDSDHLSRIVEQGFGYSVKIFDGLQDQIDSLGETVIYLKSDVSDTFSLISSEFKNVYSDLKQYSTLSDFRFENIDKSLTSLSNGLIAVQKNELKQSLSNMLTLSQIKENNALLNQFGIKVNEKFLQYNASYRVMQSKLNKIICTEISKQKQKSSQDGLMGLHNACGAVRVSGEMNGSPRTVKIATVCQMTIGLVKNVSQLTGGLGLVSFAGLAALGPISAIAIAGFNLISMFKQKGRVPQDGLKQISAQIKALENMIQKGFGQLFDNQRFIIKTVQRGINLMMNDFKYPVIDSLNKIESKLQEILIVGMRDRKELRLDSLRTLVSKSQIVCDKGDERALKYSLQLADWLIESASSPMLTGYHSWGAHENIRNPIEAMGDLLRISDPSDLPQYMACVAKVMDRNFPNEIKIGRLFNMNVWVYTFKKFIEMQALVTKNRIRLEPKFEIIKERIENYQDFIGYIQTSKCLYENIFNEYTASVKDLSNVLKDEFRHVKKLEEEEALPGEFAKPRSLLTFMQSNSVTGFNTRLNKVFSRLNTYINLVSSLGKLSGLSLYADKLTEIFPQKSMMEYKIDWANKIIPGPSHSGCHNVQQTLSIDHKGIKKLYLITLERSEITLYCYNTKRKDWEALPQKLKYPYNPMNIQCIEMEIEGDKHIVAACRLPNEIQMKKFNLSTKSWSELPSIEKRAVVFKIIRYADKGIDQLIILSVDQQAMECRVYNAQEKKWEENSQDKKHQHQIGHKYRKIIEAKVTGTIINNESSPILYVTYHNPNGLQLVSYDIDKNEWDTCSSLDTLAVSTGFRGEQYRKTIHVMAVSQDGKTDLVVTYRHNDGVHIYKFDTQLKYWKSLATSSYGSCGNDNRHRHTSGRFQASLMQRQGQRFLVVSTNVGNRLQFLGYNLEKSVWTNLAESPCRNVNKSLQMFSQPVSKEDDEIWMLTKNDKTFQIYCHKLFLPEINFEKTVKSEKYLKHISKLNALQNEVGKKLAKFSRKDTSLKYPLTQIEILLMENLQTIEKARTIQSLTKSPVNRGNQKVDIKENDASKINDELLKEKIYSLFLKLKGQCLEINRILNTATDSKCDSDYNLLYQEVVAGYKLFKENNYQDVLYRLPYIKDHLENSEDSLMRKINLLRNNIYNYNHHYQPDKSLMHLFDDLINQNVIISQI